MRGWRDILALVIVLISSACVQAGLYYSGEQFADLPSQWRGYLLDQRALRLIAVPASKAFPINPLRQRYQEAAAILDKTSHKRKLSADESADWGALLVRLGEFEKALAVLRAAQREHPQSFRIIANLGTAWQLQGDLDQTATYLQQAVRLAPGKLQKAEEFHLKLVRLRQRQPRNAQTLDDLFGIRYGSDTSKYEAGTIADAERKKLPPEAAAIVQQLALWLPADGRLLWQLGELANAHGDVRTAAAIFDGCVSEFGMNAPQLRQHRQITRAAAELLGKKSEGVADAKAQHREQHAGSLRMRSKRPLVSRFDQAPLPPIDQNRVNALPWHVLGETTLDRKFQPTFAKYLLELNGKQIELSGFMQPFGDDLELSSFMLIEYPVGCWFCELPEMTGIVLVDMPHGQSTMVTRGRVKVVGKLALNDSDPENFLYTIGSAKISADD